VRGILPDSLVTVVTVQWFGSEALELTYKTPTGRSPTNCSTATTNPDSRLLRQGRPWSFDGDGGRFRLCQRPTGSARRTSSTRYWRCIRRSLAAAAQITPSTTPCCRQPLRFLLADDPVRQDDHGRPVHQGADRPCDCSAASLSARAAWPSSADELYHRFHLLEILTNDKLEAARTGNWFLETNLVIARSTNCPGTRRAGQAQGPGLPLDLIVCDEAHKMSATFFGGEIKYTSATSSAVLSH